MLGIVVPETFWAYKKYNKIISSIYLVLILQLSGQNLFVYAASQYKTPVSIIRPTEQLKKNL